MYKSYDSGKRDLGTRYVQVLSIITGCVVKLGAQVVTFIGVPSILTPTLQPLHSKLPSNTFRRSLTRSASREYRFLTSGNLYGGAASAIGLCSNRSQIGTSAHAPLNDPSALLL